mgnify:CR=1 FL=1
MNEAKPYKSMIQILLVDDESIILEILNSIIEGQANIQVTKAENGEEAFKLFAQSSFDLIITDVKMPIVSGGQLIQKIRSSSLPNKDLPVIFISSDIEKAKQATDNFQDIQYYHKPVKIKTFREILQTTVARISPG